MAPAVGKPPVAAARNVLSNGSYVRWHVGFGTSQPADGWQAVDFDDVDWPRSKLPEAAELTDMRQSPAVLSLRAKFAVTDPAAVNALSLKIGCAGPLSVWLNGRPLGERVAGDGVPVTLAASQLLKGVNVLAVQIRRAGGKGGIGLKGLLLRAGGGGIVSNIRRPKGVQIWNHDPNDRVAVRDWGDPNEPLTALRFVGARNGTWRDQLVVASTKAIRRLKVVAAELRSEGGGAIASSAVDFLFGEHEYSMHYRVNWIDGYRATPPAVAPVLQIRRWQKPPVPDAAMVPILARIAVPKDAAAGDYRGSVTITFGGHRPVVVPVELHVADWTVPDPADFRTYSGIYQSPTSIALKYKVEPWSEAHWKLIEKSVALLGAAGNKLINLHLVEQTQFGNDCGMVVWVKKAGGTYECDFTVFDRYLALMLKHCKRLDHVALQLWHSGGWAVRPANQQNTVTVRDRTSGELSRLQVPDFSTAESKAFWKPVLAACYQRLKKLGLGGAMCLGILSDGTAPRKVFTAFDAIWPVAGERTKWMRGLHRRTRAEKPYGFKGGGQVVLHEFCYGLNLPKPGAPFPRIHNLRGRPGAAYNRIAGHETAATIIWYRTFPEQALIMGTKGVGRVCLDFWPVIPRSRGRIGWIYNRYPHSTCSQRAPSLQKMTWPGPEGAEPTIRFEALCEGMQEAEAMIVLSEAVATKADVLGERLVARCRKLMADRLEYCRRADQKQWAHIYYHMNHYGHRELSRRLLDLAAAVTAKLNRRRRSN